MLYPETTSAPEPARFQCRHIFTAGHRCGSPALRDENFCFYHHTAHRPPQDAPTRSRRKAKFTLPVPEDRAAIQTSIGEVLRRLAAGDLDPRRAGLLLYGLQIASLNLGKHTAPEPGATVEEVTLDPTHGPIAPAAAFGSNRPKNSAELLLEWIRSRDKFEEAEETEETSDPILLPSLQAVADVPKSTPIPHRLKTLRKKVPGGWSPRNPLPNQHPLQPQLPSAVRIHRSGRRIMRRDTIRQIQNFASRACIPTLSSLLRMQQVDSTSAP